MIDVEIARNAAANGRWFNAIVAAVMIAMAVTVDGIYFVGALVSALSIGAAYFGDVTQRRAFGHVSIICAIAPFALVALKGF
jgi:hypothetical protein